MLGRVRTRSRRRREVVDDEVEEEDELLETGEIRFEWKG